MLWQERGGEVAQQRRAATLTGEDGGEKITVQVLTDVSSRRVVRDAAKSGIGEPRQMALRQGDAGNEFRAAIETGGRARDGRSQRSSKIGQEALRFASNRHSPPRARRSPKPRESPPLWKGHSAAAASHRSLLNRATLSWRQYARRACKIGTDTEDDNPMPRLWDAVILRPHNEVARFVHVQEIGIANGERIEAIARFYICDMRR